MTIFTEITESKMFKYTSDLQNKQITYIAEVLFVHVLMLQVIRFKDPNGAKSYAQKTLTYGDFDGMRFAGTDLGNLLSVINNQSKYSDQLTVNKVVSVPIFQMKNWLRDIGRGDVNNSQDNSTFTLLNSRLQNYDITLNSARRAVAEFNKTSPADQQAAINKIMSKANSVCNYSDLLTLYRLAIADKTPVPVEPVTTSKIKWPTLRGLTTSALAGYALGRLIMSSAENDSVPLLEYNERRIIRDFGDKFLKKITQDFGIENKELLAKTNIDSYINVVKDFDPTANKEYTHWMIGNYVRGSIQKFEDLGRVRAALTKYQSLKDRKQIPVELRDINKLNFNQLQDIVEKYFKEIEVNVEDNEEFYYKNKKAVLLFNDNNVKVVSPKTKEACIFFGKNTRWCTSAKNDNMAETYLKSGILVIILFKKENERYQFFWANIDENDVNDYDQFMDEKDYEVNPKEIVNRYSAILPILRSIAEDHYSITFSHNPSDELLFKAIQKDPTEIRSVTDPSEKLQLFAVDRYSYSIKFIQNPTEKTQLLAVQTDPELIRFIDNPTDKVISVALNEDACVLKYIDDPSEKTQLVALLAAKNQYDIDPTLFTIIEQLMKKRELLPSVAALYLYLFGNRGRSFLNHYIRTSLISDDNKKVIHMVNDNPKKYIPSGYVYGI